MLRTLHALIAGLSLAASLSACANDTGSRRAASPQALAAYKEGMRRFEALTPDRSQLRAGRTPDIGIDYGSIERLFARAAAMGLPHGDYGVACTIYASGNRERFPEALAHAERAAGANVFEAQVLLISYLQWNIGRNGTNAETEKAREIAFARLNTETWPLVSGVPAAVSIPTRFKAEALADKIIRDGKCGPVTPRFTPMSEINARLDNARDLSEHIDFPIRRYVPSDPER